MSATPDADRAASGADAPAPAGPEFLSLEPETLARVAETAMRQAAGSGALNFDPDRVEKDLARLVLALIEFVRQLLEAQAVRRMEAGRLTAEQEERLGDTLMRARDKLHAVAAEFGLSPGDLTLDLGPLGRVV